MPAKQATPVGNVNLSRGKGADDNAGENRRQHNVAARVFCFFGQGGDAIEPNVSQDRNRGASKQISPGKRCRS